MITIASPVDADLLRLRDEFLSMPALVLTATQTARLLDIRVEHAVEILTTMEEEGWLIRLPTGAYRRPAPAYS
jgi:hypothetical protein